MALPEQLRAILEAAGLSADDAMVERMGREALFLREGIAQLRKLDLPEATAACELRFDLKRWR